jgi:hypothetical protein
MTGHFLCAFWLPAVHKALAFAKRLALFFVLALLTVFFRVLVRGFAVIALKTAVLYKFVYPASAAAIPVVCGVAVQAVIVVPY